LGEGKRGKGARKEIPTKKIDPRRWGGGKEKKKTEKSKTKLNIHSLEKENREKKFKGQQR